MRKSSSSDERFDSSDDGQFNTGGSIDSTDANKEYPFPQDGYRVNEEVTLRYACKHPDEEPPFHVLFLDFFAGNEIQRRYRIYKASKHKPQDMGQLAVKKCLWAAIAQALNTGCSFNAIVEELESFAWEDAADDWDRSDVPQILMPDGYYLATTEPQEADPFRFEHVFINPLTSKVLVWVEDIDIQEEDLATYKDRLDTLDELEVVDDPDPFI